MAMKWKQYISQLMLVFLISIMCAYADSDNTELLSGLVTAKYNEQLGVTLKGSSKQLTPKVGDQVLFLLKMDGLELDAGSGVVSRVEGNMIWVSVQDGNPNIDMIAKIKATDNKNKLGVTQKLTPNQPEVLPVKTEKVQQRVSAPPQAMQSAACPYTEFAIPSFEKSIIVANRDWRAPKTGHTYAQHLETGVRKNKFGYLHLAILKMTGMLNYPKDYAGAFQLFETMKKKKVNGYLRSDFLYNHALFYHLGRGTQKNPQKAFELYKKSVGFHQWGKPHEFYLLEDEKIAEPAAYYNLGCLFKAGEGVPQSAKAAEILFEKAAKMNFVP